ncbi:shikimate dehydrogenase [Geobacter sp. DSM 9736]|uniref:shikimate dehydrogenase n=1 Tax=Geobacter sp. DSM 9736 TaxID=1277350 RepID=UPI000B5135CE|nr:shikimate dehydrogenase [Geobacter sp. DSM 9736]SNB45844.1 shikimate dehydrogenase [Geobacter sp. DSM 9736]
MNFSEQGGITGSTRILGIIGWPVEHSLSPFMQNAALRQLGLDWVYVPFPVAPELLGQAVAGLRALNVAGFNVTIPHKSSIIPYLDALSPEASLIGAVNTVKREEDRLVGYNTDCTGFISSLRRDLGLEPEGARVVVVGAGGAARAAVTGLCQESVSSLLLVNRTEERGEELIRRVRTEFPHIQLRSASLRSLQDGDVLASADLIVNTTSIGMGGSSFSGFDLSSMKSGGGVYDMVYVPAETPLLAAARGLGLKTANGLGMLAAQGEAALRLWTGAEIPADCMKKALLSMLDGGY